MKTSPRFFLAAVAFLALAAVPLLRAESDPDVQDNDRSSYHQALLNYKGAKYDAARLFIDKAQKDAPDNVPVGLLKVRILTEQHDYNGARRLLKSLYARPDLTPAYAEALALTAGDLALRQHHFDEASKAYTSYLQSKPGDPDGILKLIYARIGAGDLVAAGKYASDLKPLDPKNPSYYFAHAALAHSSNSREEDQDIEQARTIYGITVVNRYLKTYLEVLASDKSSVSATLNPPATNAPASAAPNDTIP